MASWNRISVGDLFTLANGVLGFVAITYILDDKYLSATGLLFVSTMMDGLDGFLARKFGSKHSRGQVLDSISDSISFAFAPAFLLYAELRDPDMTTLQDGVVLLCAAAFLAAGLFRLARFASGGYQLDHFMGMPAPAAALTMLLICLLFGTAEGEEPAGYYFVLGELPWLVLAFGFASSYLMVSEIHYPKVKGWMAWAGALAVLLAVLPYAFGLVLVDDQSLYTAFSRTATGTALALTLIYVFGGPFYERLKRGKGG